MCFSAPAAPAPPPPPIAPPPPPTKAAPEVTRARNEQRKFSSSLAGDRSTLLTGARGLLASNPANTGQATLLGGGK